MPTSTTYSDTCRDAAKRQMPHVAASLIDSLPVDGGEGVYLAQTGGFTMALARGERLLTEDGTDDGAPCFIVGRYSEDGDEEGILLYEGADFAVAWETLNA